MPDDRLSALLHQVDDLHVAPADPAAVRARGLQVRRRRRAAAGGGALAVVVAVLVGAGTLLGGATTTLQPAPQATAPVEPTPSTAPSAPSQEPPAEDGPALPVFDGVDVGAAELRGEGAGRFVQLDRLRVLEGEALTAFYADQGLPPPDSDRPQVVDRAVQTITYPVTEATTVVLLQGGAGGLDDLAALLDAPRPDRPGPVFRLELRGGVVVSLTELDVAIG